LDLEKVKISHYKGTKIARDNHITTTERWFLGEP